SGAAAASLPQRASKTDTPASNRLIGATTRGSVPSKVGSQFMRLFKFISREPGMWESQIKVAYKERNGAVSFILHPPNPRVVEIAVEQGVQTRRIESVSSPA
ncbi:MAG: hypothetical protein ACREJM_06310, partial [Candidatus Saccharimonadales bacterium]